MYPVRVTCLNCPPDPHRVSSAEWHLGKPGNVATRAFTIRPRSSGSFQARRSRCAAIRGWSWRELEADCRQRCRGPARAHRCPEAAGRLHPARRQQARTTGTGLSRRRPSRRDRDGRCDVLESAPGRQGSRVVVWRCPASINYAKMKLESWKSVPIWKDPKTCQADLTSSIVGTLVAPAHQRSGPKVSCRAAQPADATRSCTICSPPPASSGGTTRSTAAR